MSSNTLRGIGQEGDGDGEGEDAARRDNAGSGKNAVAGDPNIGAEPTSTISELVNTITEEPKGLSSDAGAPFSGRPVSEGSQSAPSYSVKNPAFSATLLGVAAPFIGRGAASRDQRTVPGRDVHLPAEVKRFPGLHAIAGAPIPGVEPAGRLREAKDHQAKRFEGKLPDEKSSDGVSVHGHAGDHVDVSSHSPWYDQEPVGEIPYDDPAPNLLGRIAIGAAAAAALAVVLFTIVRLHSPGEEDPETKPPLPSRTAQPQPQPAAARRPETAVAPTAVAAPGTPEPAAAVANERSPDPASANLHAPANAPSGSVASTPVSGTSQPKGAPSEVAAPAANPASARASGDQPSVVKTPWSTNEAVPPRARGTSPRPSATQASANAPGPRSGARADKAAGEPSGVAQRWDSNEPSGNPSPSPSVSRAAVEKARSKPAYDPDSTLPLNID